MTYVDSVEDVYDFFPELHDIANDAVRRSTAGALFDAPEYFWSASTGSYYHPEEHGSRHGLVLHTKRVASIFERTADSMIKQNHLDENAADAARAGILLHDTFKYGEPPTETGSGTHGANDKVAADYYRANHSDLPDATYGIIEAHKGPWGRGKRPTTHAEQMVHVADQLAACSYVSIGVKEPNDVLKSQFPTLESR